MDIEKIGKFIKELRIEKGLSQNKLSEQIHITRQAISNWENGKAIPDSDILKQLSKMFEVSIDDILSGERIKDEKHLEQTTLNLVDEHNKNQSKIRKMLIALLATISSFILLFLLFYFIVNYNSIKVYMVTGETESFVIREGMIISTQHKNYVRIGEVISKENNQIESLELYFINNNNKKKSLYKIKSKDYIIFNYSIQKRDEKDYLKNLYIDIYRNDNKIEKMKIEIYEDFKNNLYFNTKSINRRNMNYEDLIIEEKKEEIKEERIEEQQENPESIFAEEIIPREEEQKEVMIPKEDDEIDYYKLLQLIEEKGTDQYGKKVVEIVKDDMLFNLSSNNNIICVDTLKDNIIELIQYNILDKSIFFQRLENYIESDTNIFYQESENYKEYKEKLNNYLKIIQELS